jgi:hypothetical protein
MIEADLSRNRQIQLLLGPFSVLRPHGGLQRRANVYTVIAKATEGIP